MKLFPPVSIDFLRCSCLMAVLAAGVAHAQTGAPVVLYTLEGSQPGERLGWSLVSPGDLNGDGVPDILAGGPGDFISGGFPGIVRAYSGLDGGVLYTVSGQQNADGFGMAIAVLPDLDGDGRPDFAVGAPYDDANGVDSGSVYVLSGGNGALIRKLSGLAAGDAFGWSLCDGRDFNGDGSPDLVIGAPLSNASHPDAGTVYLFDPVGGAQLNAWSGSTALAELGYCVASAVRGGAPLVKMLFATAPGMQSGAGAGTVLLWSPGQAPATFYAPGLATTVGLTLSAFSVSAGPGLTSAYVAFGRSTSNQSSIDLYSEGYYSTTFAPQGSLISGAPSSNSISTNADGAGVGQVLAGLLPPTGTSSVCWSDIDGYGNQGATGPVSLQASGVTRAWALTSMGFLNSDGTRDFAIGDPSVAGSGPDAGRVQVFLRSPSLSPPTIYCTAKTNSLGCTPHIWSQGGPSLSVGDNFFVGASEVLNNKPGLMLWSLNQNNIPFGGGTLCVGPLFHRTGIQFSGGNPPPSDCSGSYSFHFSQAYMSAQALTPGVTVYCQYYSRDDGFLAPQNIGLTDAVRFTVFP